MAQKTQRSNFERELQRGLLACVARLSIGLTDKVWLGHGEMNYFNSLDPVWRMMTNDEAY